LRSCLHFVCGNNFCQSRNWGGCGASVRQARKACRVRSTTMLEHLALAHELRALVRGSACGMIRFTWSKAMTEEIA
jgi:hypothetical protein